MKYQIPIHLIQYPNYIQLNLFKIYLLHMGYTFDPWAGLCTIEKIFRRVYSFAGGYYPGELWKMFLEEISSFGAFKTKIIYQAPLEHRPLCEVQSSGQVFTCPFLWTCSSTGGFTMLHIIAKVVSGVEWRADPDTISPYTARPCSINTNSDNLNHK